MTWAEYSKLIEDLKRVKVGDRKYDIVRRSTGERVGGVVQTGERSRDWYPWEGECAYGYVGSQQTLSAAVDKIAALMILAGER